MGIHNRGFGFLVPIGRSLTRQEEKNDVRLHVMVLSIHHLNGAYVQAEEDTDESTSALSGAGRSVMEEEDGENDSVLDMDANMEDQDVTAETEDNDEGDTEDFEGEPSDII